MNIIDKQMFEEMMEDIDKQENKKHMNISIYV